MLMTNSRIKQVMIVPSKGRQVRCGEQPQKLVSHYWGIIESGPPSVHLRSYGLLFRVQLCMGLLRDLAEGALSGNRVIRDDGCGTTCDSCDTEGLLEDVDHQR